MEHETHTAGITIQSRNSWLSSGVELISSMRFAISLLCLIAIAATIGTVMRQNEPYSNYVNQFGPFWFEVFQHLGLYALYSSWWFLLMMTVLVVSTSLCLLRNTPKMLKDMRSWRDNVREQSLRNFHHKAEWQTDLPPEVLRDQILTYVQKLGYQTKVVDKQDAFLIAAKQGTGNKWGYIFAHAAIVIICVGGMLDSDLAIRFQTWFMDKVPYEGNGGIIAQIPAKHRLAPGTPTFRGNTSIPEGQSSNTAIIQQTKGVFLQDLPFTIQLKKFNIEYYSTGMPKLFASEVVILDHQNGKSFPATVKVNQPLIYKGIAIFQSSVDDGGSHLRLKAHNMLGSKVSSFDLQGDMGGATLLGSAQTTDKSEYTIEWSGFRPFNVENMARNGQDLRAVNINQNFTQQLSESLDKHSGSAGKNANNKNLKNVGPSIQYKLRDRSGQAREFMNYMQSVMLDGSYVFLSGVRENPNEQFHYLRMPADDNDSLEEWMRLRAALSNPALRAQAAAQYAKRVLPEDSDQKVREQLAASATKEMYVFAGEGNDKGLAGLAAVDLFLKELPVADQNKATDIFIKILNGSMWELWQLARKNEGLSAIETNEKHARFLQLAIVSLSEAFSYGAPVYLQLTGFEEIKASVFQVTRAPGQNVVYLGCLFLIMGVFAMFYIRERRLWIWIKHEANGSQVLMALSSQRKTLDFEREFEILRSDLTGQAKTEVQVAPITNK